ADPRLCPQFPELPARLPRIPHRPAFHQMDYVPGHFPVRREIVLRQWIDSGIESERGLDGGTLSGHGGRGLLYAPFAAFAAGDRRSLAHRNGHPFKRRGVDRDRAQRRDDRSGYVLEPVLAHSVPAARVLPAGVWTNPDRSMARMADGDAQRPAAADFSA